MTKDSFAQVAHCIIEHAKNYRKENEDDVLKKLFTRETRTMYSRSYSRGRQHGS